ncbi:MAG: hypothetical protein ACTHMV_13500 [Chitinophagaceae bacterium]
MNKDVIKMRMHILLLLFFVNVVCTPSTQQRCERSIKNYLNKSFKEYKIEYIPISFTFETFYDSLDAVDRTPLRYRLKHKYLTKDAFGDKEYSEDEFVVTSTFYVLLHNGDLAVSLGTLDD